MSIPLFPSFLFVAVLCLVAAFSPVQAQNFEKIGPRLPASATGEGKAALPEANPSLSTDEEVLVKELRAIVLQSGSGVPPLNQNQSARTELPDSGENATVSFQGFSADLTPPEPEKLVSELSREIGHPISMASIRQLVVKIIKFYRAHDRPLVDVTVPEQDVTGGTLHLTILESRLGEVRAQKNRWFASSLLESQVRLQPGSLVRGSRVVEDLHWLNNNPFRQVNALYTPGKSFGTTDVILETQDRFPLRVYTGYENSGSSLLGNERWLVGANWGNGFGLDHLLSYQFTTSDDFKSSLSHSFSYTIPLPWRHTLLFFGSFSQSNAPLLVDNQEFRTGGGSSQASFRYTIPLPGPGWLRQDISTGFDFKRSNNNLDFGGIRVFDKNTDIFQWFLGYEAQAKDRFGSTLVNASGVFSPGNLNANNSDAFFDQSRAYARADYLYGRISMERLQRLPSEWSLDLRATGQLANGNLLASEQLGVGGSGSVRGLAEGAANGDEGILFSTELRTPPMRMLNRLRVASEDQLQFLGFIDYGTGRQYQILPGEQRQRTLASFGIGFRYLVTPYFSARCDYGWRLVSEGGQHAPGASFGMMLSF